MNENTDESVVQTRGVPAALEPDDNNQTINPVEQNGANIYADGANDVQIELDVAVDYDAMPFEGDDSVNPVGIKEDG